MTSNYPKRSKAERRGTAESPAELHGKLRERCRDRFSSFLIGTEPEAYTLEGRHLRAICRELQAATEAVERGESYYVAISCPPRHGKSEVVSRRFGTWYLGRHPDHEIILSTYGAELSQELSRDARRCAQTPEYIATFGHVKDPERWRLDNWGFKGHSGSFRAVGIGGSITGHGAHGLILDDPTKGREEAESELIRSKIWDSFRNDLMTRLAPSSLTVVCATRWHEDDIIGRIERAMSEDPKFPRFKILNFSAQDDEGEWLFPARFRAGLLRATEGGAGALRMGGAVSGQAAPTRGQPVAGGPDQLVRRMAA